MHAIRYNTRMLCPPLKIDPYCNPGHATERLATEMLKDQRMCLLHLRLENWYCSHHRGIRPQHNNIFLMLRSFSRHVGWLQNESILLLRAGWQSSAIYNHNNITISIVSLV